MSPSYKPNYQKIASTEAHTIMADKTTHTAFTVHADGFDKLVALFCGARAVWIHKGYRV
jgi:hypothetical protein